ncbi:AAA family ATPase [Tissierella carlieri]|uniref:AAA family ATPase n=1 Tax=Tissierella carlieri TaxID=689904 RepID=UPI002804383A|nr:AAA family ATPase [uncultured Tissierella sp.]MDU5080143.1 AAA family ATPase [Bacillota bacterium]
MKKTLILVAGMPGAGKTRFANYLSEKLQISLICKDKLKEIIWDKVHYDTTERTESKIYAGLAYDLSFYFCEMLMSTGQSIIFESNFTNAGVDIFQPMVQKYGYKVITVLFDGDSQVIHRRFVERDVTSERHPGLVSNGFFDDFEVFKKAAQNCGSFKYGDVMIYVDSTDYSKISYDDLIEKILSHK